MEPIKAKDGLEVIQTMPRVPDLFRALLAMQANCIYRLNQQCWHKCEAREWCQPQGLEVV